MFKPTADATPDNILMVLLPKFSMMPFAGMIEALRIANMVSGKTLYSWKLVSKDEQFVTASNGVCVQADCTIDELDQPNNIVLCSGINVHSYQDPVMLAWLRRVASSGAHIGALCTGAVVLARAGLLKGYRCTVHWNNLDSFSEEFPDHDLQAELFEIDRTRFTCGGGTASVDMALHEIISRHGRELGMQVSDQFMHERVRQGHDTQRMPLRSRLGVSHPKLIQAIAEMENNTEFVLSRNEIAINAGLSRRQLERLFRRYLKTSPARYYLKLRLNRAQILLMQTAIPITEIAFACGFTSASHFSKCYRDMYAYTPRSQRNMLDELHVNSTYDYPADSIPSGMNLHDQALHKQTLSKCKH